MILKPKLDSAFQPMLIVNESFTPDSFLEKFPQIKLNNYYISPKLDGVRCIIKNGEILSRSLKPLPNIQLKSHLKELVDYTKQNSNIILDGELFNANMTFQEIISYVMHQNKEIPSVLQYYLFDSFNLDSSLESFTQRYRSLVFSKIELICYKCTILPQNPIPNPKVLHDRFAKEVASGGEGLILKHKDSKYKFGRTTINEMSMFKFKPWKTFDAEIISVQQATIVDPSAEVKTNELGNSVTSRKKDDRIPTQSASAFIVKFENTYVKVSLSSTTHEMRETYWKRKDSLIGKTIEYKGTTVGAKNVPRHPVFIRFRPDK